MSLLRVQLARRCRRHPTLSCPRAWPAPTRSHFRVPPETATSKLSNAYPPRCASAAHVLVEPRHGALPRLVGGGFVVALRRRVVVEAVHGAWIDMTLVGDLRRFHGVLVLGPRHHQPSVLSTVMHEHCCLDLWHIGSRRRATIER